MAVARDDARRVRRFLLTSPTILIGRTRTAATARSPDDDAGTAPDPWPVARWRHEWRRVAPFVPVLLLLEAANWYLLNAAFGWVLPGPILPGLTAAALILFLIATVFARSLLAAREMRSHQLRLRITLVGLVVLQIIVNTVQGFGVARGHMPATAAEFFGLSPVVMARIAGIVMGGGLALVTLSYLLFVVSVLDKMAEPLSVLSVANSVLGSRGDRQARGHPGTGAGMHAPGSAPPPGHQGGTASVWLPPESGNAETEMDPQVWGLGQN